MAKTIYADTNAPVKQRVVANGTGYLDLVLNLNRSGKAIRIADRVNGNRVHVTMGSIDDLIAALQQVRDKGVKTSVRKVEYDAA